MRLQWVWPKTSFPFMKPFQTFSATRSLEYPVLEVLAASALLFTSPTRADDWPQWMGPQRDGVWREKNILEKFPDSGLDVVWRINVNRGYCGPAVVGNRLFMMDRQAGPPLQRKPGDKSIPAAAGNERVLCLDAANGKQIWEHT